MVLGARNHWTIILVCFWGSHAVCAVFCSRGWHWTCDLSASTSQVQGLQAFISMIDLCSAMNPAQGFEHTRQALCKSTLSPPLSRYLRVDNEVWVLSPRMWSWKDILPYAVYCIAYHEPKCFYILHPSYARGWPWRSRAVSLRRENKPWWSIIINSPDLSDTSAMRKSSCSLGQNAQNCKGHGCLLQRASTKRRTLTTYAGPVNAAVIVPKHSPWYLPRIPDPKSVGAWAEEHFTFIISVVPKCWPTSSSDFSNGICNRLQLNEKIKGNLVKNLIDLNLINLKGSPLFWDYVLLAFLLLGVKCPFFFEVTKLADGVCVCVCVCVCVWWTNLTWPQM
jgi:hypothetical protein